MGTLKIGSKVQYRGAWGIESAKVTTIEGIELCDEGEKYGTPIDEVTDDILLNCTFDLADGHWCYGHQIDWIDSLNLNKSR